AADRFSVCYLERDARALCAVQKLLGKRAWLGRTAVPAAIAGFTKLGLPKFVQQIHPHMIAVSLTNRALAQKALHPEKVEGKDDKYGPDAVIADVRELRLKEKQDLVPAAQQPEPAGVPE
ncbi:conserved hypothetical protein, partial [Ricinus communis]